MWLTKVLSLILLLGLLLSCQENKSPAKFTADLRLPERDKPYKQVTDSVYIARDIKIYNDVLNDLIKNHFYFYYLGDNYNKIYEGYDGRSTIDTVLVNKRQRELTEKLSAKPDQLCILYVNNIQNVRSKSFDLEFGENTKFEKEVKAILNKVDGGISEKLKYLSKRQQLFNEKDFHSSIAKISVIHDDLRKRNFELDGNKRSSDNCKIGILTLSNIILNKEKEKGILYYEFYCGSKCGRGELAEIEKIKGKWKIVDTVMFWIS